MRMNADEPMPKPVWFCEGMFRHVWKEQGVILCQRSLHLRMQNISQREVSVTANKSWIENSITSFLF